jgi:hypothetical protein
MNDFGAVTGRTPWRGVAKPGCAAFEALDPDAFGGLCGGASQFFLLTAVGAAE